jgi:hypothetical protein
MVTVKQRQNGEDKPVATKECQQGKPATSQTAAMITVPFTLSEEN